MLKTRFHSVLFVFVTISCPRHNLTKSRCFWKQVQSFSLLYYCVLCFVKVIFGFYLYKSVSCVIYRSLNPFFITFLRHFDTCCICFRLGVAALFQSTLFSIHIYYITLYNKRHVLYIFLRVFFVYTDNNARKKQVYREYQNLVDPGTLKPGFTFSVMNYNVLAQSLLEGHKYHYTHHDKNNLPWKIRWKRLLEEIKTHDCDVSLHNYCIVISIM